MFAPERQHDLVVCLTALESKLVQTESLTSILQEWIDSPTTSLIPLLREHGVLNESQHQQLAEKVAQRLAESGLETASMWQTVPHPFRGSLFNPNDDLSVEGSASSTFDRTSAHPAPIVGGKNDERFQILNAYAEGGLGEVSIAQDQQLGRMVALKQIKNRFADDAAARARFLLEAQVTGRLEHPGIVPVYSLGFDPSGRPYYAMRFVEGESLQEVVRRFHDKFSSPDSNRGQRVLELRKLVGRIVDVCHTIDYAHSRGILHRDLKPSNILLGKYGETLVVDWGLAKVLGGGKQIVYQEIASESEKIDSTVTGTPIGTPAYMSPEQAKGRTDDLSPQTDVYSLGVTLYYVLTCRLPHEENSVSGVMNKIQEQSFARPREHCPWLPAPLEAICLKAMSPHREDRYITAAALAEDIERWLANEPVKAHTPTLWEATLRWLGRNG